MDRLRNVPRDHVPSFAFVLMRELSLGLPGLAALGPAARAHITNHHSTTRPNPCCSSTEGVCALYAPSRTALPSIKDKLFQNADMLPNMTMAFLSNLANALGGRLQSPRPLPSSRRPDYCR